MEAPKPQISMTIKGISDFHSFSFLGIFSTWSSFGDPDRRNRLFHRACSWQKEKDTGQKEKDTGQKEKDTGQNHTMTLKVLKQCGLSDFYSYLIGQVIQPNLIEMGQKRKSSPCRG